MKLARVSGVRPSIMGTPSIFGGRRQPIQVNVQGPEESRLKIAAQQVAEAMKGVPGVADVNSSDDGQVPQLNVAPQPSDAVPHFASMSEHFLGVQGAVPQR